MPLGGTRCFGCPFFLATLFLCPTDGAFGQVAEHRVAMVMGNAAYQVGALSNPVNDAQDLAAVLRRYGFDVALHVDCTLEQMGKAVNDFGARIATGDVALFY